MTEESDPPRPPPGVVLLPFSEIRWLPSFAAELGVRLGLSIEVGEVAPLFARCWDSKRKQFDGRPFLDELEQLRIDRKALPRYLGVLCHDLFGWHEDRVTAYGRVYGYACMKRGVGLISLWKLTNRERATKVAVHEIGHMYGLVHCQNECVMKSSDSLAHLDQMALEFCEWCQALFDAAKGFPCPY